MRQPEVRRVGPEDAELLRRTRLAALADAPDAFGTALEVAEARDRSFWERQCDGFLGDSSCATWIAWDEEGEGTGMLAGVDVGNAVDVIQVWVAPTHRGSGLVDRLFDAVFDWSPHDHIEIAVAEHNQRALSVYKRMGFKVTGQRPGVHGAELLLSQIRSRT